MKTEETPSRKINLVSFMTDYAVYNAWANAALVTWLRSKPADLPAKEVPSSFPSQKLTLLHIWDTQRFWLSVLKKEPAPRSYRNGFDGTQDEIMDGIISQSEEFASYIQSMTEESILENVQFVTPWISGTQTRIEFIHHCLNHSTYHRGQVVTIGRNIGLTDAPMTDYSYYLLLVKQAA